MSVNYEVDIDQLSPLIDHILNKTAPEAVRAALQEVGFQTNLEMQGQCPSSLKSGRGYRGPPLRHSIQNKFIDDNTVWIGPPKMVDGHNLGLMMEKVSTNQRIITPTSRTYLKFFWKKTGRIHFEKSVKRGIIPPNPFVRRTYQIMLRKIPRIVLRVFEDKFMADSLRFK